MAIRVRSKQEFQETPQQIGPQLVTLASFSGGYNGYTSPELLSPQFWAQASNVYSGQFGTIRRARFAPVVGTNTAGYTAQGTRFSSLFSFRDATPQDYLLGDIGSTIWAFNVNGNYAASQITDSVLGTGSNPLFAGPWSRTSIGGIAFGMNGQIKRQWRGPALSVMENFGLDTPDAAPSLAISSSGPNLGTVVSDLADRANAWTNPNNIVSSGIPNARVSVSPSAPSDTLKVTGFALAATGTSPIYGITVALNISCAVGGQVLWAQLLKAGTPVGNLKSVAVTSSGSPFVTLGSLGDTWGATFIGSDVNAATFGVQIYVTGSQSPAVVVQGNALQITVFFPTSPGGGNITKTIGRSYQFAWENANIAQVGAPSPASPYIPETNQINQVQCLEAGTCTTAVTSKTVSILGSPPSAAWVNRHLWVNGIGDAGLITSVTVGTSSLTLQNGAALTQTSVSFQVFDPQATHLRLYATGDGQPVYFRIQRNAFVPSATNPISAGLVFIDNDNSEPPNGEFTAEIAQTNNLPPPIGNFLDQYGSRIIVYGVPGAPSSFFYSNFETTSIGLPPDCFAPLNMVTLPMGDAKLFGTANLPTGFIIWSNKQDMFKLTGQLTDNTVATDTQLGATIQRLPYKIGSGSPFAVAVTSLGVIWLSSDRQVWLFTDHYAPKNIGLPIQDVLNSIGSRLQFAKMKLYKQGDRHWLELSVAIGTSAFNNKKCILDLSLLASNGSPSFFTFDMATNQPSWYLYDVNCEAVEVTPDSNSIWHTLSGDVDKIIETDWTPYDDVKTGIAPYFTSGSELQMNGASITLHALGNEAPQIVKETLWIRCNTNQLPKKIAGQGWQWAILAYDDDAFVMGVQANTTALIPGVSSSPAVIAFENSPAVFRLGGVLSSLGRRFQYQTLFPTIPGFWEFRSMQVQYENFQAT